MNMNASLIQNAKRDPEAFGELYDAFYDSIYRFVYLRVNDQELTEDLVSHIWEKVLTNLRKLKDNTPEVFRAWIFTIARNAIHEHFRHAKKETNLPNDWDAPGKESPIDDYKELELSQAITLALQGLPPLEREIVGYKVFGELKNKEIARLVDRPENTVAAYLSRALKQLQSRLSHHQL